MNKKSLFLIILIVTLLACNTATKKAPVTDIEVATTFVRDILDRSEERRVGKECCR